MDAKLVVVGGEARVTEVQLKLPVTIGRGRSAGLTLPHPLVSRQHCEIYEEEGKLVVNDLGSLNGTFVGDQRIGEPTFLMPGELLTVGTVTFRAVYELSSVNGEVDEESTGTEHSGEKASPSAHTVQFDKTVADVPEEVEELLEVEFDEAEDNETDGGEIAELVEVDFAEEEEADFGEVEDVEEVEAVDEAADDDVPQAPTQRRAPAKTLGFRAVQPVEEPEDDLVEPVDEAEDVAEVEEVDQVAEIDDVDEVAHGPPAKQKKPDDKPKPKPAPSKADLADTEAADHDTKEVQPDEAAEEVEDDDDELQAFLRGLG